MVPIKVGMFGAQGSGKSTSAALLAAAISAQFCNKAPVVVVDPEAAWQFLKRRIFDVEGIELIQRPDRTFKGMAESIKVAEKAGACVWIVDPLTLMWHELMQSFKAKRGYIPIDVWGDIKQMWSGYILQFLNTGMNCIALGRLGNEMEEIQDEDHEGKTKLVKTGTKFKAGGGESFGYEPHLLLELSLERKAKVKQGSRLEGEGRIVHRADVLKDRTWALNGKVIRWSDKPAYQKGGFRQVWESLKPHWDEVQGTAPVQIPTTTSESLVDDHGRSDYFAQQKQKQACLEEWDNTMQLLYGGMTKDEKNARIILGKAVTGAMSRTEFEDRKVEDIRNSVALLQEYQRRTKLEQMTPTKEADILAMVAMAKEDLSTLHAGRDKTLLQLQLEKSLAAEKAKHPEPETVPF